MKVIHILPYSSLVTGQDFKVDLFADGYHVRVAQQIWKRTQKYQLECWRPERKLKEAITGEKDGITYRAFPSFRPSLGFLDKFVNKAVTKFTPQARWGLWREYSLPLLRELKKQCQDEEVLIHLYQVPFDLSYLICLYLRDVPIIGCPIGGAPYTYSFSSFIRHLPFSLIERKVLGFIDKLVVSSTWTLERWSKFHANLMLFYPIGVDFNEFKPLDKKKARDTTGIPLEKRVILHVGRFDAAKGVDVILRVFQELKCNYNLELLLVGGLKTDPLYEEAISCGARVYEWLSQGELLKYYSAADLYVFARFYHSSSIEDVEEFMGFGVAPLESLACGTPVVGTNLKHFLGTDNELKGVGKIPQTTDDVAMCIVEVLEHPELYHNCRQIVQKYYSWNSIVAKTVCIYDELFYKYKYK